MTHSKEDDRGTFSEQFGEMVKQEFWIVFKAFFAPIIGTIAVYDHLRKVIRLVDAPPRR